MLASSMLARFVPMAATVFDMVLDMPVDILWANLDAEELLSLTGAVMLAGTAA